MPSGGSGGGSGIAPAMPGATTSRILADLKPLGVLNGEVKCSDVIGDVLATFQEKVKVMLFLLWLLGLHLLDFLVEKILFHHHQIHLLFHLLV